MAGPTKQVYIAIIANLTVDSAAIARLTPFDVFGNIVVDETRSVTVVISGTAVSPTGSGVATFLIGAASRSNLRTTRPGLYTVSLSDPNLLWTDANITAQRFFYYAAGDDKPAFIYFIDYNINCA